MTMMLAVGLGYSARAIAEKLAAQGWQIAGTARGPETLEAVRAKGYEALPFDGASPSVELARALGDATHLLVSAAPDASGDPLLARHGDDIRAAKNLKWIGYLSTIGVYGDQQGAWIDETAVPLPKSDRSHWRLGAEQAWQDAASGLDIPLQIFRLAGIYGPGRNPLERMKAGRDRTVVKPGQVFNRIHVEDIAATIIAGIEAGAQSAGIFNVADDEPAAPEDVAAFAADLLGIDAPPLVPFDEAEMSPMAQSFYSETKRILNGRIKGDLGVALTYPTFREGLSALAKT